ncbi:MAG: response regulator [Robiginitomaculum sp.]|nr:response regulator [Robiginitomaculum sp.]MDQ7078213.1 response regulator [Robiginitomaculum sp.]
MSARKKILLAHNERIARETLARDLSQKGYDVRATETFDTLWRWIRAGKGDIVLIDVDITDPARNGFELLKQIREAYPHLPALVLSAENTVLTSLLAARFGAFDYFPKPFSFEQLNASITAALQTPETPKKKTKSRTDLPLVGSSEPMQAVYRLIAQATQSTLPILITGETGTGKSLVAKMLHEYGLYAQTNYEVLHFPLADEVFDETLAKACTNAKEGTLVLDEISALSDIQQARLISMLSRLDDQEPSPRLIATTRLPISDDGNLAGIGHELLFRLNTLHIHLPALRDRQNDIVELAQAFVAQFSQGQKKLGREAERSLCGRPWPGNVRELRNVLQRAALMTRHDSIAPEDVMAPTAPGHVAGDKELDDTIARALAVYLNGFDPQDLPDDLYIHALAALEKPLLKSVMAMAGGNQLKAAKLLGINRNTLHKKLVRYKIIP